MGTSVIVSPIFCVLGIAGNISVATAADTPTHTGWLAVSSSTHDGSSTADIEIELRGLRSDKGFVAASVFSTAQGFPGNPKKATALAYLGIQGDSLTLRFSGLPTGQYAIALFHDENANKTLDTNLLGIPKEGVAATNRAHMRLGPPRFSDAVFELGVSGARQVVVMRYL